MDSPTDKQCAHCGKSDNLFKMTTVPDRFAHYIFCKEGNCVEMYSKYVYGNGMDLSNIPFCWKFLHQSDNGGQLVCKLCREQGEHVLYAFLKNAHNYTKVTPLCSTHPREVIECLANYLDAIEKMNALVPYWQTRAVSLANRKW